MPYRISWMSCITGYSSHGDYCFSFDDATNMVAYYNMIHPLVRHTVESQPSITSIAVTASAA